MKAVILAGGEGTRLRPLTRRRAKVMVPVLNRPLLSYTLERLAHLGIDEVILTLAYRPDDIIAYFGDGYSLGLRLTYVVEDTPLGSGGAVKNVAAILDDTFLVLNGDIFTDLDLRAMISYHRRSGALITIALAQVDDPSTYGVVEMEPDGRLLRFLEKPPPEETPSRLVNAGTWIFETEALEFLPQSPSMVEYDLFPRLLREGWPLYGFCSDAYWMDVGPPQRYLQLHHALLKAGPPRMEPGAWVDPSAAIEGAVLLGPDCNVGSGARVVGPSCLGESCIVEPGAVVEGSVLWEGVQVGSGARLRECVVASRCRIEAGVELAGAVLEEENVVAGA